MLHLPAPAIEGARAVSNPTRPGHSLTRRAWLTAVASLLDYGSKLAVGLLVTPLLVAYLGRPLFGTWEILMRVVGYMSVADGRPMEALRLVLANTQATADAAANRRTIGMAVGVWCMFLPLAALGAIAIVWFTPAIARTPPELVGAVRLSGTLLVVNFLLASLVALPEAVLFGTNQGYRRMGLVAGVNVVGGGLTIGAIWAGLGLVGLAAAQVVLTLVTASLFLRLVRKYVSWFGIARPTRAEMRWFAGLSGWALAGDSLAKLLLASDVVILGFLVSASAVTSYVLTGYATQAVVGVLTLSLGAIVPGLAGVVGQREYGRAAALRAQMLAMGWLTATLVGSVILLWNAAFLHLWVGSTHYAGAPANTLLVLMMVQTILIRSDAYVLNALLRVRERVVVSAAAAGLSCVLAVLLVPRFAIPGLCASLIVGRLIQSIGYPMYVNRQLGRFWTAGLAHVTRPALVMLLLFAVSASLGQRLRTDSWTAWLAGVVVSLAVMSPLALMAGLQRSQRAVLLARVKAIGQ